MNRILLLLGFLILLIGTFYLISDILLPFLISLIFAYLLQPIIDINIQRFNLPRSVVTFIVFIGFVTSLIGVMIIILPMIYDQIIILMSL